MENQKLEFRFGAFGKYIPLIVAIIFILIAGTHQSNVNGYCLAFFAAIIAGVPFAKDFTAYGEAALHGLTRPIFAVISVAIIIAAISGKLVSSSGLISTLAHLIIRSGINGSTFAAISFVICCVLSMSTGTSVGTNVVSFPVLFPVGVLVGANPAIMAGALVSGALFGDNLAPISDTTIASANTQEADMGGVVRTRVWYSIPAAVITFLIVLLSGGSGAPSAEVSVWASSWAWCPACISSPTSSPTPAAGRWAACLSTPSPAQWARYSCSTACSCSWASCRPAA